MTTLDSGRQTTTLGRPGPSPRSKGAIVAKWLTTTDHKVIGNLYLITSMVFFAIGGAAWRW